MTLATLGKIFAPTVLPRNKLPEYAMQVYFKTPRLFWVTKTVILRNPPYTIFTPHPRQAAWRFAFAKAAKKWKGAKGTGTLKYDSRSKKHRKGDVVLAVQAKAQEVLKKLYESIKDKLPGRAASWVKEIEEYRTPKRIHTEEELKRFIGEKAEDVEKAISSALE